MQVYLEECKYWVKNTNVKIYKHWTKLKSDSDSEKIGARVDNELEKSGSDSE